MPECLDLALTRIEQSVNQLLWMVGANIGLVLLVLWKVW
jgi:hypothetical protein